METICEFGPQTIAPRSTFIFSAQKFRAFDHGTFEVSEGHDCRLNAFKYGLKHLHGTGRFLDDDRPSFKTRIDVKSEFVRNPNGTLLLLSVSNEADRPVTFAAKLVGGISS